MAQQQAQNVMRRYVGVILDMLGAVMAPIGIAGTYGVREWVKRHSTLEGLSMLESFTELGIY